MDHALAVMAQRVESLERLAREREIDVETLRRKFEELGPDGTMRRLWIGVMIALVLAAAALVVTLAR